MKSSTSNFIVISIIVVVVIIFLVSVFLIVNRQDTEEVNICDNIAKENFCRKIGKEKGLDFQDWIYYCEWGGSCNYFCKFLDEDGEVVLEKTRDYTKDQYKELNRD